MDHCRLAGISCMALVSDKEGIYVKVNQPYCAAEQQLTTTFIIDMYRLFAQSFIPYIVRKKEC